MAGEFNPTSIDLQTRVQWLKTCTFTPGSWDKRFVRNMDPEAKEFSAKQTEWINKLFW